MICEKCGKDYPNKIWKIHTKMCKVEEDIIVNMDNPNMYKEMKYNDLREEAGNLGITLDKNPKKEKIIEALELLKFGQVQ